jgi:hypothetical protein
VLTSWILGRSGFGSQAVEIRQETADIRLQLADQG